MEDESVVGDWIRQKVLGSGSFGTVSWWRNLKTDKNLAIKICKLVKDDLTPKHKERWSKEVEMMNSIRNDNIVGTVSLPKELELGLVQCNLSKLPMLCMEYCSMGDLRQLLNNPLNSSGLSEMQVRHILSDLKSALSHLHELKITHRDLKPENIVLHVNGSDIPGSRDVIYKLIDLGYAKEIDSNSVCASFVGTLQYLAPELLYSKTYSNTVDYWSLGLVAFEVICGVRPFLPNMPPVQWMNHVKVKTLDHICVFENFKGEVEYSKTLFQENHISSCFQELMEKWLKIALDWDSKRRGRMVEDKCVKFSLPEDGEPKESPVVIFSVLDSILTKKVLRLFSVATYNFLSYELEEGTPMSAVQGWLQRDTGVPLAQQLLVSCSLCDVEPDASALNHWNLQLPIMLYVYQYETLFQNTISPMIPSKLRHCLEVPQLKCKYSHLVEIFTDTLYFVLMEKKRFDALVAGLRRLVEHLKKQIKRLSLSHNESDKSLGKLNEKAVLLSSILEIDNTHIEKYKPEEVWLDFLQEFNSWANNTKIELEKNNKLRDAFAQLTVRLQSVARRCNALHEQDLLLLNARDLDTLQDGALKLLQQVRSMPKENRNSLLPCLNAVKVICKCIKVRDKLLNNVEMKKTAQQLIDIQMETNRMSQLIISTRQNADILSGDLTALVLEKEKMIFRFIDSLNGISGSVTNTPLPSTILGLQLQPVTNFKIGAAVSEPRARLAQGPEDLHSLIKDSVSLRHTSRNIISKSYQDHKSMLQEMDFSFLEKI